MPTPSAKTPVILPEREKLIDRLPVPCGVLQKQRWQTAFGTKQVAAKARELLDAAAAQVLPAKKAGQ